MWRDRIEYLARYWNNEAVDQVQRSRQDRKGQTDESFATFLEQQFGRTLGGQRQASVEELGRDIDNFAGGRGLDVVQVVDQKGEVQETVSSFSPRYAKAAKQQTDAIKRATQ